ncbi:MAG TPA: VWA domain-containing protein [Candidatus Paceibacterota bacterium]
MDFYQLGLEDISKIVFLHPEYTYPTIGASILALLLYLLLSMRVMRIYKIFGGIKHCNAISRGAGIFGISLASLLVKSIFMSLITLLIGLIIMTPRISDRTSINEYRPTEIQIAFDFTVSMLAEDQGKQRLEMTKEIITDLLNRLRREGQKDKVGLLLFSDIAIPLVATPTKDYELLERELRKSSEERLRTTTLEHGSNVWDPVTWGIKGFDNQSDFDKILIIIGDGEQTVDIEHSDATRQEALEIRSQEPNVKIFIVSLGSQSGEQLIPKEKDQNGNTIEYFVQKEGPDSGSLILTKPDPVFMRDAADILNGVYIQTTTGQEAADAIDQVLDKERIIIGQKEDINYRDITPFFILGLLLLLLPIPFIKL